VVFAADADGARHVAAYRRRLGLSPVVTAARHDARRSRRHKAAEEDLDLGAPLELVALAVKQSAARCRILGTGREVTLRSRDVWRVVPGEILTVRGRKQWRYAGHPYLSGDVDDIRLDVAALGLGPLRLEEQWTWDPAEEHWGEEGEPLEAWARPIVARGPRPSFEMEQVLPGADPDDPGEDPILEASELQAGGDPIGADKLLMEVLAVDLRCLDAHAHLGNFAFPRRAPDAIRHYEVGVRIGELSVGEGFDGVLPWGRVDNRPFLRCLHGWGLCLWRLSRSDEAALAEHAIVAIAPALPPEHSRSRSRRSFARSPRRSRSREVVSAAVSPSSRAVDGRGRRQALRCVRRRSGRSASKGTGESGSAERRGGTGATARALPAFGAARPSAPP
jgi:hypothetical protein